MVCHKMLVFALVTLSLVFVSGTFQNAGKFPVGSRQNPGNSCKDILVHGGTLTGIYCIRLGGQTLQVYCDQTTAGGGWTLVLSYTFTDFKHFDRSSNAITPRPNWPVEGNTFTSVTPPKGETDFNAMNFFLWKKIGSEFMIKSNINNWYACSEGSGSLVNFVSGTIKCKLVKNFTRLCSNIVPNAFQSRVSFLNGGPLFYNKDINTLTMKSIYYLESLTFRAYPTHDPCGIDWVYPALKPAVPHGNIYIR